MSSKRDAWRTRAMAVRHAAGQASMGGKWAVTQPAEVQHNLRSFWFDGLFASASDAILLTYLTLYVLQLGANEAISAMEESTREVVD